LNEKLLFPKNNNNNSAMPSDTSHDFRLHTETEKSLTTENTVENARDMPLNSFGFM